MSTHNKYFAPLGPVREPHYRIGQRIVVNGSADAHRKPHAQFIKGTLPGYRYSVSLLAVIGKYVSGWIYPLSNKGSGIYYTSPKTLKPFPPLVYGGMPSKSRPP